MSMQANDLASRRCEPRTPGTPPLSREEIDRLLPAVPGWRLSDDGKALQWTHRFKDFDEALAFVNRVGEIANAEDHHPDIRIYGYRNVDLELSTHSIGGLSENDFIMAAKINSLVS